MKLAVRRTYHGDRLCFADLVQDRLVDVQAAHAHQLVRDGACRDDAVACSRHAIAPDLPALLLTDPDLTAVREAHEHAMTAAQAGDLPTDCLWPDERHEWGPPSADLGRSGECRRTTPAPAPEPTRGRPTDHYRISRAL